MSVPRAWRALAIAMALAAGGAPARASEGVPDTTDPWWPPFAMLGDEVAPGESKRLELVVTETLEGTALPLPVIVHRGVAPGPTLCLTAGVHGDEVNGVEVVRRVAEEIDASALKGTLISVPIVNLSAVRRGSRYLPDRRDLNRYFPGRPGGSSASRIAYRFFDNVIRRCDDLVDIHTGSFHRSNLHQVRADLSLPAVLDLARGLGAEIVVHNPGRKGTLRGAAVDAGVPAVTVEAGEPARLSIMEVQKSVESIRRLMVHLGMLPGDGGSAPTSQTIYYRSMWVRADGGGILVSEVALGQQVSRGETLGTITDPLSSRRHVLRAPSAGRVIGMAFDQLVMPGFATIHLAIPSHDLPREPEVALHDEVPDDESSGPESDLEERPE